MSQSLLVIHAQFWWLLGNLPVELRAKRPNFQWLSTQLQACLLLRDPQNKNPPDALCNRPKPGTPLQLQYPSPLTPMLKRSDILSQEIRDLKYYAPHRPP